MQVLIQKISLKSGVKPDEFEKWVHEHLYPRIRKLRGLKEYYVTRASNLERTYFEVSHIENLDSILASSQGPDHSKLVKEVMQRADVSAVLAGDILA